MLSHGSAAALWRLVAHWPRCPEITAPRHIRREGLIAHRSTTLTGADVTTQLGVRTTTAARTLVDIRARLTERRFTRLVNQARLDHVLDSDVAYALLGHRRNATRSGNEDDFQAFVTRYGLPQPQLNVEVGGYLVDALFAAQRVIVEIDDFSTHGDPVTFADDRERDTAHTALGYVTVRLVRERFTAAEARRLRGILDARSD